MGVDANLGSSNARLRRLQSMLAKPPSGTALMVCHVVSDPPLPVGEWDVDQLVPALADELDALMVEQHTDGERAETKFSYAFLSDADEYGKRRSLRVRQFSLRGDGSSSVDIAAGIVAQMDGTDRASNILAQQVALQTARMYLVAGQQKDEMLFRLINVLTERNVTAVTEADDARDKLHELRELIIEQREIAREEAPPPPETMTEAQKQFWELASKALPVVLQRLAAGATPKGG